MRTQGSILRRDVAMPLLGIVIALFMVLATAGTARADTSSPSPSTTSSLVSVVPKAPTFSIKGCSGVDNLLTIPAVTGVNYFVNGQATAAGEHSIYDFGVDPTTLVVVAKAGAGYVLSGTTSWSFAAQTPECVEPKIVTHCGGFTVTNQAPYPLAFEWGRSAAAKPDGYYPHIAPGRTIEIATKRSTLVIFYSPSDDGLEFSVDQFSVPQGCATSKPTPSPTSTGTGTTAPPATHTSAATGPLIVTDGSDTASEANAALAAGGVAFALGSAVAALGLRRRLRH